MEAKSRKPKRTSLEPGELPYTSSIKDPASLLMLAEIELDGEEMKVVAGRYTSNFHLFAARTPAVEDTNKIAPSGAHLSPSTEKANRKKRSTHNEEAIHNDGEGNHSTKTRVVADGVAGKPMWIQ